MRTGDFNGDLTSDLLWRDTNGAMWSHWLIDGGRRSASGVLADDERLELLTTGDFNNDGTHRRPLAERCWRGDLPGLMKDGQRTATSNFLR